MRSMVTVDDRLSTSLVTVLHGASRTVVLVGHLAFKFPSLRIGWRPFLRGLIANSLEREWWHSAYNEDLCPVPFSIPGGWLVVMPRCEPVVDLTQDRYEMFVNCEDHVIPAEFKDDSFGWLGGDGGRLVAVDYG